MSVQELDLVVTFLDVGHGDSAIIRFREDRQERTIVVDGGGPLHSGSLLGYLLRNGITTVDLMVATHIDRNHIAGLLQVAESDRVTIHNFWGPACESTQPSVRGLRLPDERAYQRLYSRLHSRLGAEHIVAPFRRGPAPVLFREAAITVLNPPQPNLLSVPAKDAPPKALASLILEQNELALVLHIEVHGIRMLLGSDVQGPFWVTALGDPSLHRHLDVNILKVPDYGRPNGFPAPVAAIARAEYAVFSIGAKEDKQPSSEVISLFREMQAEVLCTEHVRQNTFCSAPHCHAADGGQNIVFCRCHGDASYSTSAYHCPPGPIPAPPSR